MSIQESELAEFGEFEGEYEGEYESEYEGEFGEYEGEYEGEGEGEQFLGDILGSVLGSEYEAEGETEQFLGDILGTVLGSEYETPLSEAQESELAAELLEITSEQELEQFLGNIFKSVGGFIRSPVGRALGGVLKNVAKKALPVVGGALGSMVAPGIGTTVGSKLGSMASGMFEVELEAMPGEAAEFEVARRVVNTAASAAHHAAMARPRPGVSPQTVARAAVAAGARHHAPGVYQVLIKSLAPGATGRRPMGAGVRGGVRRPPMTGRPGYRAAPGRPAARPMTGRPGYRVTPSRPMAARRPAGPGTIRRGAGYPAAPAGQRRRPTGGAPAYRGRRGYGWGYGDWYTPYWTDGGGYYDTTGYYDADGTAADAAQASGRWVRRGRQIVLYGV